MFASELAAGSPQERLHEIGAKVVNRHILTWLGVKGRSRNHLVELPSQFPLGFLCLGTDARPRKPRTPLLQPLWGLVDAVGTRRTSDREDVPAIDLLIVILNDVLGPDPLRNLPKELLPHLLERLGRKSLDRSYRHAVRSLDTQHDVAPVLIGQIVGERADRPDNWCLGLLVPAGLELEPESLDPVLVQQDLCRQKRWRGHWADPTPRDRGVPERRSVSARARASRSWYG
ncbi:hypothetical protein DB30_07271 [Enhygromyxa salina]|uniref:Uncharacterized protein n=1 Tax=Enhygromyxa salina TaxID=215803 RepID=A0A0C1Z8Z8_9BACT|nr:hypothetical protein DB30_07271 [Enhygromyxa salina]